MNKYIVLTKDFLDTLFSQESLPENVLFSFRVDTNLLVKVPSENISLIEEDGDVYLSIISNNGDEYQLPELMFTDSKFFSVLSMETIESEDIEESKDETSDLDDLIRVATIKVQEFNSISVEVNNLKKAGVSEDDEEFESLVESLTILERELKTLTVLIRAEKKFVDYSEQGKTQKALQVDEQINKILDTYAEKYGVEAYNSLLLLDFDDEDESEDLSEDESEDITFDKDVAKQLLASLIEEVQNSEVIEKYVDRASNILRNLGISDKNVKNTLKVAKTKVSNLKDLLLKELNK